MLSRTEINLIAKRVAELIHLKSDELLTAKQCAEWLGISMKALYARVCRGQIPYHKRHDVLHFSKIEVTAYYLNDNKPRRETADYKSDK